MPTIHFPVEKTGTGFCAYAEAYSLLATGQTLSALQQEAEELVRQQCAIRGVARADYALHLTYDAKPIPQDGTAS